MYLCLGMRMHVCLLRPLHCDVCYDNDVCVGTVYPAEQVAEEIGRMGSMTAPVPAPVPAPVERRPAQGMSAGFVAQMKFLLSKSLKLKLRYAPMPCVCPALLP
jgi:hypothetical protein